MKAFISFTTISNEKFYQSNQGRKTKFTGVIKRTFPYQDLFDQLNDAMDDPMSRKISNNYYKSYEATPLTEIATNNFSF